MTLWTFTTTYMTHCETSATFVVAYPEQIIIIWQFTAHYITI